MHLIIKNLVTSFCRLLTNFFHFSVLDPELIAGEKWRWEYNNNRAELSNNCTIKLLSAFALTWPLFQLLSTLSRPSEVSSCVLKLSSFDLFPSMADGSPYVPFFSVTLQVSSLSSRWAKSYNLYLFSRYSALPRYSYNFPCIHYSLNSISVIATIILLK